MKSTHWVWVSAVAVLVTLGAVGSVLGSTIVSRDDAQQSRQRFSTAAVGIASTLKLSIQQENGLAVAAEAFIGANPSITSAEFLSWTTAMQLRTRFPEVSALGFYEVVRPAQLPQFIARVQADPPQAVVAGDPYTITPAGARPLYCLLQLEYDPAGASLPLGYDICAADNAAKLARVFSTDTRVPYTLDKQSYLALAEPVYPANTMPTGAAARSAGILGIAGLVTRPAAVLDRSLSGNPATSVALRYGTGSSAVTFTAGKAPAGARSKTISLHDGWSVEVDAAVGAGGFFNDGNALALLLGGLGLSLLLGALILALGTGRSRALALVAERTQELNHLALYDSLTQLPNRALILDRIEQMLARTRREHGPVAVLFLDLDNFKDINDTLGHAAGDQLLVAVAARLAGAIRQEDTVGRLGGDEFVVVAEGASLAAGVDEVAGRILDVMGAPFAIGASDLPLEVSTSIGIAEGRRESPGELLRDADIALYRAKAAGKNRAVIFAPQMQEAADDSRGLEVALNAAFAGAEFFLLYQPAYDLSSGTFTGVEALLRWRHPTRGVVQPDEFIPALESNGLIVPVGHWVLEEACRQGARWQREGHRITVAINVSAKQLERDQIVDDVRHALEVSGFDPTLCVLELTETTLMHDVATTVSRLSLLKGLGVRLAIDDFGTGYSSLAYLRQFPIDVLKIDQSFVSGLADTAEAVALVHAMVQLGKALGLKTVAEGVETEAQRARLRAENVDSAQGFLFARPLDCEQIDRLLADPGPPGPHGPRAASDDPAPETVAAIALVRQPVR